MQHVRSYGYFGDTALGRLLVAVHVTVAADLVRRASSHVIALLVLVAADVWVFRQVYFSGSSFPADFTVTYYPLTAYWISSVSAGEWPGWVPYIGMGYPFAAQPQSGAFYPLFWVFAILHLPYSIAAASALQALHVLAGGLGSYALVYRLFGARGVALIGGTAYLLYGGFYSNAEHADIVRAFALMPWFFWAILLVPDSSVSDRWAWGRYRSGLSLPNLAIPLVVYLLVTGGYPGCTIAISVAGALFLLVQSVGKFRGGQPLQGVTLDLAVEGALLGLGAALAGAFIVPLMGLSSELLRTNTYLTQDRVYLELRDLFELVLPSAFLRAKDHSMFGMQLPLALIPLLAAVRSVTLVRLLPFLAVTALAGLMSLDLVSGVSGAVARVVPLLGLSRFPAGDYRTLIALPLLLAMCGGVNDALALARRGLIRSTAVRYIGALSLLILLAAPTLLLFNPGAGALALGTLASQLVPAMGVWGLLLASERRSVSRVIAIGIAVLAFMSMVPVLSIMQGLWRMDAPELARQAVTGISVWSHGTLTVDKVFRQHYAARPPRTPGEDPLQVYWSGYLAGNFTMGDNGSVALAARENLKKTPLTAGVSPEETVARLVQMNPVLLEPDYQRLLIQSRGWVFFAGEPHGPDGLPQQSLLPAGSRAASGSTASIGPVVSPESKVDLTSFMQQGSTLVAVHCTDGSCTNVDVAHLPLEGSQVLAAPDFVWQVNDYGRSSIAYHVTLSQPALVVENELYSSGWHGRLRGTTSGDVSPVRVDGSVRGWLLPAGDYDFTALYSTPLLGLGVFVSVLAAVGYLATIAVWILKRRRRRPTAVGWQQLSSGQAWHTQTVPSLLADVAPVSFDWRAFPLSRLRTLVGVLAVTGVVVWAYFWFATGGKYEFRGDGGYYGWLSDAFLAGQTYLKIDPPPALLNLPDPYDPAQHGRVAHPVPDGSLYKGKYFLYFGPVPALIHAAWQIETGQPLTANLIVFLFGCGTVLLLYWLLRELRDEVLPRVSDWALHAVFLAAVLGGVGLYLQGRPIIHHEALASACMFVLAGCLFWLRALRSSGAGLLNLAASGLCFGLAIGSRTTEAVYAAGVGIVLLARLRGQPDRLLHLKQLLAFGLPLSVLAGLLLIYNYIRFDSPFEFGTRYVLTGIQNLYQNPLGVFDLRAVPDNLLAYLTYVPTISPYFPFVVTNNGFIPPVRSGVGYAVEPPFASALLLAPVVFFLPVTAWWAIHGWRRRSVATRAFLISTSLGLAGACGFVLATNFASGRYLEEVLPLACVLSALGLWAMLNGATQTEQRHVWSPWDGIAKVFGVGLVAWSTLAGGLLGIWELGLFPDAFQSLAYPIDSAEAALIQRVDTRLWPSSYLDELPRRRPWGVFYPDGAVVRYGISPGGRAKELNMWSLFSSPTMVRVIVNGMPVGDSPVEPGQVRITFPQPLPADQLGHIDIQLAFPQYAAANAPPLWPITLWSIAEAP